MKILVDTSVWSLAFRRRKNGAAVPPVVVALQGLIEDFRANMIGAIRQEILSGIAEHRQFHLLERRLAAFPDLPITSAEHIRAAEMFNLCRRRGVQGSHIDFLICAAAERHECEIFTLDKDFVGFAKILSIKLYKE